MNTQDLIHMNQVVNCQDCKRFRKYFTCLKALRKLVEQIAVMTNKLDDRKNIMLTEFYTHIETHFPEEKNDT